MHPAARVLVCGVGNVLHRDDGFGVELAWRLQKRPLPPGVTVMETGIGGISLVQELMRGYAALLLLDAHAGGHPPGSVRLLAPVLPDLSSLDPHELRDYFADSHYATPMRALALLERLGRLPRRVGIVACEPEDAATLSPGLSDAVRRALDAAETLALDWVSSVQRQGLPGA